MSLYDKMSYAGRGPEPPSDKFEHATPAQINYIEILRKGLGMSLPTQNAHILNLLKKFQTPGIPFDVYCLSKAEASKVIGMFKEWKEGLKNG